jgi:hypothetical protein
MVSPLPSCSLPYGCLNEGGVRCPRDRVRVVETNQLRHNSLLYCTFYADLSVYTLLYYRVRIDTFQSQS